MPELSTIDILQLHTIVEEHFDVFESSALIVGRLVNHT